jgi:hypothetical protein
MSTSIFDDLRAHCSRRPITQACLRDIQLRMRACQITSIRDTNVLFELLPGAPLRVTRLPVSAIGKPQPTA